MVRKAPLENLYRLTPLQEGMLYATLLARRPGVYVEQASYRLTGSVDPELLGASWNWLAARHAPFRTAFLVRGVPQPLQAVLRERSIELCSHDLRGLTPAGADRRLAGELAADRRRGFDLARDPLLRLALYRRGDREHVMVLSFHHVVMDGWCQEPLLDDLLEIYGALRDGRAPDLPPVRPYAEYIAWLAVRHPGPALGFWRAHLAGYRTPAALPRIPPSPGAPCGGRAELAFALDADATAGLERLARAVQVTASTVVRALWGLALASATGRADVVFGAVVSGRPAEIPGVERMVGLFINTIPVRVRLDPEGSVPALLRALHDDALRVQEHEHASLAEVQAASGCGRGLLDHVLVFENYPGAGTGAGARNPAGFGVEPMGMEEQFSVPLTVQAFPGDRLGFRLVYDPAVFAAETLAEMGRRVRAAAAAVLREEPRTLGTVLWELGAALPGAGTACPDERRRDVRASGGMPANARQAAIAAIWSELLGGVAVGADDDFFALGAHSLTALRAVCRMQRDLDAEITLHQLLEHPTVAGVDALLGEPPAHDDRLTPRDGRQHAHPRGHAGEREG